MWSNLWHVSLPLMHWWLLQNSWFFYVWCSLYDFGSLWVSFQDCSLACRLPNHFLVNFLLKASHAYFSLLYLSWDLLANIFAVPTHFITLFFGLPRPIYYLFISFTLMGFLLNLLDFPSPITTYLLLITTWAYWLLGQPIEFPNSFPRLPQPI